MLETLDGKSADDAMNVFVLLDYLEQHGAKLTYDELVTMLRRQSR
ncbi:MAG: hypothetical protein QM831_38690 [Kofleriaceae bacterium]